MKVFHKTNREIRAYFAYALKFLEGRQRPDTFLSAVVHMDEKTPHLHLCFVPLTADGRLSAKEIIGNRKNLVKWQDEFWQHMVKQYQLIISGGDIKAVQGTTGHASADMLVNTYAHIQQSSRVELGKKFESGFYAKPDAPSPQAVPAAGEPTISMTALLELLKDADPEMKAKLRLALLT